MKKNAKRRVSVPSTDLLAGCCVYRLADGCQCKRSATELTTWGAFCWQHASPVYAIRHIQQATANAERLRSPASGDKQTLLLEVLDHETYKDIP